MQPSKSQRNTDPDGPVELESQFILRLPPDPARALRDALRNNSTLRDRFNIKIEDDMRHAEVRIDHWLMPSKIVDLPTIVESLKTIDNKGFYKTADICQMLLCKEEDDGTTDEDSPQKSKKKDPNKVEKKYLWPHGITPPCKNVRKRRFRKTLKKKYVEAPEIEKEVKRLLRIDNDAVSVKWEVINEEDEKVNKGTVVIKKEPIDVSQNVAEHDIFGGTVSDSEEEDVTLNVLDMDETSQPSVDDNSHLTDSNSVLNTSADKEKFLTEFSSEMFNDDLQNNSSLMGADLDYYGTANMSYTNLTKANIENRLEELEMEMDKMRARRHQQELEIEGIENVALRQRLQDILDRLNQELYEKDREHQALQELLKQQSP